MFDNGPPHGASKEERDAYYRQRDIDRQRVIHERRISVAEGEIAKLEKALAIANTGDDREFVETLQHEIELHQKTIRDCRRAIVLEQTGATVGNWRF